VLRQNEKHTNSRESTSSTTRELKYTNLLNSTDRERPTDKDCHILYSHLTIKLTGSIKMENQRENNEMV
jgi:hypothetical protein